VVFNGLDSPWAIEILRGTTSTLTEGGAHTVLSAMPPADDPRWPHSVIRPGRSGVIVVSSNVTERHRRELGDAGVPLVVVDPADIPNPEVASVGATNWAGGLAATEHLIGLGHTRIAAIGGTPSLLCSRARIDGYRAAHDHHGLTADPRLVRHGDFHHEGGFVHALELLALDDPPTAIFAGSDQQAFGVIQAARARGMRVPDDLSVVGFDDLPVARWSSPPLTTVVQPLAEMGRTAARMLLRSMSGQPLGSRRVELATQLVVRETTAPPPDKPFVAAATVSPRAVSQG
jgi:LacI family transcriptional regulator